MRYLRPLALPIALAAFLAAFALPVKASELSEHDKIAYLLTSIESSDATFIRNGSEYEGKEARAHLEDKLRYAGSRVQTAEDFVSGIASKSSMTGQPYYVRLKSGTLIESGTWLHEKLAQLIPHPPSLIKKQ